MAPMHHCGITRCGVPVESVWVECSMLNKVEGGRWNNVTGETDCIGLLPSSAVFWGLCTFDIPEFFIICIRSNVSLPCHSRRAVSVTPLLLDISTPDLSLLEPNKMEVRNYNYWNRTRPSERIH